MTRINPDTQMLVAIEQEVLELAKGFADQFPAPFPLRELVESLGLGYEEVRDNEVEHGALQREGETYKVVIRRRLALGSALSPRERFTLAHELGHYVVDSRYGFRPTTKSYYWQLEQVCDAFAGELLVPEKDLKVSLSAVRPFTPSRLLGSTISLANRTGVSFPVAGRRVVDAVGEASLCDIELSDDRSEVRGLVRWVYEGFPFVGGGRRMHITEGHPLCEVIDSHQATRPGQVKRWTAGGADVASQRTRTGLRCVALVASSN